MKRPDNFKEMLDFYFQRTLKHILTVGKYCDRLIEMDSKFEMLYFRKHVHDYSKLIMPEIEAYVFVTWMYKCKDEGVDLIISNEIKDAMKEATVHHVTTNTHHPEYHSKVKMDFINAEDRDEAPAETVHATLMPEIDIAEMVADWCAMSEEKGSTPHEWAAKNEINARWKFSKKQRDLIHRCMDSAWYNNTT